MNTFLPYPDFEKSAKVLDYRRLGKQRVEVFQLLNTLYGQSDGWRNHPCTKMWKKNPNALVMYGVAICKEWISRGYQDTLTNKILAYHNPILSCQLPSWVGDDRVHQSHRVALVFKDRKHYSPLFPEEAKLLFPIPYYWPD